MSNQVNNQSAVPEYLGANQTYWEKGYTAYNVDHNAFRFFGRILRPDFGLPRNNEALLDFGCGQGSAVNFFAMNGFDAYGSDISEKDVSAAKIRYPYLANKFSKCLAKPSDNSQYGPLRKYRVITAIQSLYYFTKNDFNELMRIIYEADSSTKCNTG